MKRNLKLAVWRTAACAAALALITAADRALHVNPTTAALTFLIAVLFVSAYWGLALAIGMSVSCTLAYNFFFLPPTGTFTIAETANWVALAAFCVTALLASHLAERARREAAKAIAAETERQSERLRSALLDSVAHEFRTPLTGIKAAVTSLLSDGEVGAASLAPGAQRELLSVINEESDRLDALVGAASQMARLEASAVILHHDAVEIGGLLRDAVVAATPHLQGHRVEIESAQGIPAVRMDRERTLEALRQLLENAGKYSAPGGIVRVRADLDAAALRISVIDHGPGIPQDEADLVFNKFFRGTGHRQRVVGSGMGLAIAKALIDSQGGSIGVNSIPGATTVFYFTLPLTRSGS